MNNIKTIVSNHNKVQINKSDPTDSPMIEIVTAGIHARAPWTENATTKTLFTKPRSRHQPQEKHTLDFSTQAIETITVSSFRNKRYKQATELSKYIWSLKDRNIVSNIKWRKVKQARSYSNSCKRCNLCLRGIFYIFCQPEMSTLNNRSELMTTCRHSNKFLLKTVLT